MLVVECRQYGIKKTKEIVDQAKQGKADFSNENGFERGNKKHLHRTVTDRLNCSLMFVCNKSFTPGWVTQNGTDRADG
jgi:hypothetical protein